MLLLALLRRGEHVLEAVLEPAHGPRHAPRDERDQDVLRIDDELGAEAPADVGRDHAHLVRRQVEEIRDELADLVRHLGGRPHRELAERGIPVRHEPARLHGLAPAASDAKRERGDARRRAKRGLDVPAGQGDPSGHVVGDVVVDGGRSGRERLGGGERLVLDLDQLARVLGGVAAVRHHGGHRLADEPRAVAGEQGEVAAAKLGVRRHHGERAGRGAEIVERDHVDDSRMLAGARGVHAKDARMRVRAAQEHDVQHAGQGDVAHVAPAPGEQPRVFLAQIPVADELHAGSPAPRRTAAASSAASTMFW